MTGRPGRRLGWALGVASCGAALLVVAGCAPDVPDAPPAASRAARSLDPDSLLAGAMSHYRASRYDSARVALLAALDTARRAADERAEAHVRTWLGLAAWRLGELATARAEQEAAIALKQRLGMRDALSRSQNGLGLLALDEGRNREALALFEAALASAEAVGDTAGIARAVGNAALAHSYLGDLVRGREGAQRMRAVGAALDSARIEGNGLANEAMVDVWEGDARSAMARLDSARVLYRRLDDAVGEQNALKQLATAHELVGAYDRAFSALDSALSLARAHGLREQEAETLRLLGQLHLALGDDRRAVRYYESGEAIARDVGSASELGPLLHGGAEAYRRLGNLAAARSRAAQALQVDIENAEPAAEVDARLLLAELAREAGDRAEAERRWREADDAARRAGIRGAAAAVALARARAAEADGDARRALREAAVARELVVAEDYAVTSEAWAIAARAHARAGRLDSAARTGRRAVDALERVRASLASEPLRAAWVAGRVDVYADHVLTLLRLGRDEEALMVADRARSRGLLEHLGAVHGVAGAAPATRELADGEVLLRRIDALVERLRSRPSEGGPPDRGGRAADVDDVARLAAARAEYEALVIRAARVAPRATAVLGGGGPDVGAMRAALGPREVLVEYFLARDRLVVFVLSPGSLEVVERPVDARALTQRVRLLRDVWGSPRRDWRIGLPAAGALHATLVAPLREAGLLAGAERLVVVPHGLLGQVPFAALHDEARGRYLVEDVAVAYAPSAAALAAVRARAGVEPSSAGAAFAPLVGKLPASGYEAAAFGRARPGADVRLGAAATERSLRAALASRGVVHVATHGELNALNPMFSRLELARAANGGWVDDGRLEAHEVLGLPVRSPLVFLSGCETGARRAWIDDPVRGTADLTLSHAFLSAGAAAVVSTLWRIDDAGAATFASRFYARLGATDAAAALAGAQRELARDARYAAWASPYHWAGFTLSGDGRVGSAQSAGSASVPRR